MQFQFIIQEGYSVHTHITVYAVKPIVQVTKEEEMMMAIGEISELNEILGSQLKRRHDGTIVLVTPTLTHTPLSHSSTDVTHNKP
jgi:hypothetical protein